MSTLPAVPELGNVVPIDWYDENDTIVVTPRDQKRFIIQKDIAIEALRLANMSERFTLQLDLLLEQLAQWVKEHASLIHAAILTLQDGTLMFVVVRSNAEYDENLQDDLSDLAFDTAQDTALNLIRLRTTLLPPVGEESLKSFIDPQMALLFQRYGK